MYSKAGKFLHPFAGVRLKCLLNFLNYFAYADNIFNDKATLKQWLLSMLLTNQKYYLFALFKQNAVMIITQPDFLYRYQYD